MCVCVFGGVGADSRVWGRVVNAWLDILDPVPALKTSHILCGKGFSLTLSSVESGLYRLIQQPDRIRLRPLSLGA